MATEQGRNLATQEEMRVAAGGSAMTVAQIDMIQDVGQIDAEDALRLKEISNRAYAGTVYSRPDVAQALTNYWDTGGFTQPQQNLQRFIQQQSSAPVGQRGLAENPLTEAVIRAAGFDTGQPVSDPARVDAMKNQLVEDVRAGRVTNLLGSNSIQARLTNIFGYLHDTNELRTIFHDLAMATGLATGTGVGDYTYTGVFAGLNPGGQWQQYNLNQAQTQQTGDPGEGLTTEELQDEFNEYYITSIGATDPLTYDEFRQQTMEFGKNAFGLNEDQINEYITNASNLFNANRVQQGLPPITFKGQPEPTPEPTPTAIPVATPAPAERTTDGDAAPGWDFWGQRLGGQDPYGQAGPVYDRFVATQPMSYIPAGQRAFGYARAPVMQQFGIQDPQFDPESRTIIPTESAFQRFLQGDYGQPLYGEDLKTRIDQIAALTSSQELQTPLSRAGGVWQDAYRDPTQQLALFKMPFQMSAPTLASRQGIESTLDRIYGEFMFNNPTGIDDQGNSFLNWAINNDILGYKSLLTPSVSSQSLAVQPGQKFPFGPTPVSFTTNGVSSTSVTPRLIGGGDPRDDIIRTIGGQGVRSPYGSEFDAFLNQPVNNLTNGSSATPGQHLIYRGDPVVPERLPYAGSNINRMNMPFLGTY